jgi:alpha-1,2-mannosyltransferase
MSRAKTLAMVAGPCVVFGIAAWLFYFRALASARGEDWMVYDTAIRTWFDNDLGALYDGERLTTLLNARFVTMLAHPLPLHPWLYPPHYLMMLLPFGLLPPIVSGALFLALGFGGMVAALCAFIPRARDRMMGVVSVALCPATAITVYLGQNTFLTCALLLGGFGLVRRRPVLGGIVLGALTYKPQFWMMVPVTLVAERQWKTLAAALCTVAALALGSVALFGIEPWHAWFLLMTAPSELFAKWNTIARLNGQSIYTYAMLLGAAPAFANALQAVAIAIAAASVWWCHRRPMRAELRAAMLLAATVLAAPHIIDYDALMLGLAATLIFVSTLDEGPRPVETLLLALVWVSPFVNPPSVFPVAYATPLVVLTLMGWIIARSTSSAAPWLGAGETRDPIIIRN